MGYSPECKSALLKRMLPPNSTAIRHLSEEEGIYEAALHKWRAEGKGQLLPDASAGPKGSTAKAALAQGCKANGQQTGRDPDRGRPI